MMNSCFCWLFFLGWIIKDEWHVYHIVMILNKIIWQIKLPLRYIKVSPINSKVIHFRMGFFWMAKLIKCCPSNWQINNNLLLLHCFMKMQFLWMNKYELCQQVEKVANLYFKKNNVGPLQVCCQFKDFNNNFFFKIMISNLIWSCKKRNMNKMWAVIFAISTQYYYIVLWG